MSTGSEQKKAQLQVGVKGRAQRPRAYVKVLSCLLGDIRAGVYRVGQPLPSERDLMEAFGVGRPAVREALAALTRIGLVDVSPGMRAHVRRLTLKRLLQEVGMALEIYSGTPTGWRQLFALRFVIEISLTRLLAGSMTDSQMNNLKKMLEVQRSLLDAGNIRDFATEDIRFHRYLVRCMNSKLLALLAENFSRWLVAPLYASMRMQSQGERTYAAHCAIYQALQERSPDMAEKSMRTHLEEMRILYQDSRAAGECVS